MVLTFLRRLQGERPGMSAGRVSSTTTFYHQAITIANLVRLCDVSFYQGAIDFVKMREAGISGVVIRAGQRNWVDVRFRENWAKARAASLPRASYWFYDSREDPKKQAALWWSLIKDDKGELFHCADLEESFGGAYASSASMRLFLEEFQRLSGLPDKKIVVYSGYYWWNKRVGNNLFFVRFQLWLAWYADASVVGVPLPWLQSDLLFWQYTSSGPGPLYGVSSKEIDLDWYCCDLEHFCNRFGLGPVNPPEGETMYSGKVNIDAKLWDRIGGMQIATLQAGAAVTGDAPLADGYVYLRTPRAGWTKKLWLFPYAEVTVTPPPPEPPPPTTKTVTGISILNPEKVTITFSDGTTQTIP